MLDVRPSSGKFQICPGGSGEITTRPRHGGAEHACCGRKAPRMREHLDGSVIRRGSNALVDERVEVEVHYRPPVVRKERRVLWQAARF